RKIGKGDGYLMMLSRRLTLIGAVAAVAVLSFSSQAQASTNSGWIYTKSGSGAAFFDADLNGSPGYEKVTVCDNKSDGRGIRAVVQAPSSGQDGGDYEYYDIRDPSNDGHCSYEGGDMFKEEEFVSMEVCEYWHVNGTLYFDNCEIWWGNA